MEARVDPLRSITLPIPSKSELVWLGSTDQKPGAESPARVPVLLRQDALGQYLQLGDYPL
jgi:hypothetical protein